MRDDKIVFILYLRNSVLELPDTLMGRMLYIYWYAYIYFGKYPNARLNLPNGIWINNLIF